MTSVKTQYGDMTIIEGDSVVSRALAIYGEWAMDELNLLSKMISPGMCVLDVGAFIGTHTLAFSKFVGQNGKVYSFEPRKEIHAILARNVSTNNCLNVRTFDEGLAEKEQTIYLNALDINQAINFGGLTLEANSNLQEPHAYRVKVSTIDGFGIEKIDIIKLDVEGMERRVLDGAVKTVLRDRPIIFCECNSLFAGNQILEFCKTVSYDTCGFLASAYNPDNFNSINENIFGAAKELALLLIPKEKMGMTQSSLLGCKLLKVVNIEDLVLPLLHKPQYAYEVLAHTASCANLGINFPSPLVIERDDQIANLNQGIAERDGQIANLNQGIAERDGQIANLNQGIAERDGQIANLNQGIAERDLFANRLIGSTSWQITKPFRWIARVLRGEYKAALDPFKRKSSTNVSGVTTSSQRDRQDGATLDIALHILAPIKPTHPTAVIIPIYRGVEMTERCIRAAMPSVLALPEAKMLAINDASPNEGMQEMLEQLATQWPDRFIVLKNENNLGFVRTVNRGLAYLSQYDIVLLNSDVIVPKDWLSRLTDEAYSRANVGTVTPFSNNATICSFPYFLQENVQPFDLDVDVVDAVFRHEKLSCIEAPTGVGFCMYIRRACLDKIGYLNEEKFGRGYGEENDLCQRALKSGWLNLISPNMYAFHEGGVSFSSDKQALVDRAMQVLDVLHPNYHGDVQKFTKDDPLKSARVARYVQLLAVAHIPKVLHISHSVGGGVKQHIDELAEYYDQRIANILLAPCGNNGDVSISLGTTPYADSLIINLPNGYASLVELLKAVGVSAVHFHHTHGLDSQILKLPTDLGVAYLVTAHDFYWLGGNPTLTDESGKYPGFYSEQLHNPLYPLPSGMSVKKWQEPLRTFIESADCVIFPSNSTKLFFENVYHPANSVVASHIEQHLDVHTKPVFFTQKHIYNIGVLGALGREKGADLLENIAAKARKAGLNYKFKLIGYAYRPLNLVETTGPYETKDLKKLIQMHELDIVLFTAQWPETYSYTLSYALDSGLPIIAPNVGAFPERLSGRPNTMLFNYLCPVSELLEQLNKFIEDMLKNGTVNVPAFEKNKPQNDFYNHDYFRLVSRDLKIVEVNNLKWFGLNAAKIISGGLGNKKRSRRETLVHILWQLHMNPYLRWISQAIPHGLRRAIRRSLSRSNSHDIARGSKDKR